MNREIYIEPRRGKQGGIYLTVENDHKEVSISLTRAETERLVAAIVDATLTTPIARRLWTIITEEGR